MSLPLSPRRGLALLACLLLVLTGCSSLSGTGDKGYVTGDGQIRSIPADERGEPIELTGEDLDGNPLSLADSRGGVTVVNLWWSACPPCRVEMPDLVEAAQEASDATFVGINIRDASTAQPRAFVRSFEVPYPSFFDPSGKALLPFAGALSPRSIPSTVLLDAEGRLAAVVIGRLPSKSTLLGLIEDVGSGG